MARALARIGADRVVEAGGRALPRTPEQAADPATLGALLRAHDPARPALRRVTLPGVEFESSNCRNFLVAVEAEPGGEPLPATLYVKLPCRELATRAFANAVGFWAVECAFARSLAHRVPIRVPRVFAVAERGARFALVLENLHEDPTTHLFTNRDTAAGTSVLRARRVLETFAELHAAFWGRDAGPREALLPRRLHPYLSPGGRGLTRALGLAAVAPAHRAAPELFTADHAELCRRALARWDAVVDAWYREPLTLIHGDSHLANCFEYGPEDARRIGMIDFQGTHWCHGLRDVQYFLADSLDPALLAAHESELIDAYLAALARHGVRVDPADARDRYRAYSFQTLMVAVVSFGLGSLTERDETLRTILARSLAAVERLDFAGWLEGRRGARGLALAVQ